MNIHEYQAKQIFKDYGIPTLVGYPAFSIDDVKKILDEHFTDGKCVIKAQVHAGGRGKAGGVKVANNVDEALKYANEILGMTLVTKQTGKQGKLVRKLYLEQTLDHSEEYYLSLTIDTNIGKCVYICCKNGGGSIEEIAQENPESIKKLVIEPSIGFDETKAYEFGGELDLTDELRKQFVKMLANMYKLFIERDCSLIEINPLTITDNNLVCLDAKVGFDSGAFFRHPENLELRDLDEENPLEVEAQEYGLSYVSLDGNIGCICNGAGLGMSCMDTINYYGGHPANFLDTGGSVTVEKAYKAFELVIRQSGVEGIVVNIFGGIARTDFIAEGVVKAINDFKYTKPVVCRIEGNSDEVAHEILKGAPENVIIANSCSEACQKMIKLLEDK